MKKIVGLLLLLMMIVALPVWADDGSQGVMVKGERVSWRDAKAGDVLLLQNATGTWNFQYSTVTTDLSICFLNGTSDRYNRNEGSTQLDVTMTPLSSDNLYRLVTAPPQKAQEGDEVIEVSSFYLQHVDSREYVMGVVDPMSVVLTEDIKSATAFRIQGALASFTEHAQWRTTGLVDDQTAVFTHYDSSDPTVARHFGPFWNYGYSYYGTASDIITWNLYRPAYDDSPIAHLNALLGEVTNEQLSAVAGTDPGCYPLDKSEAYETALKVAQDFVKGNKTDDALCWQVYEALKTAFEALKSSFVPLTDGYYTFVNAYPQYEALQKEQKAMTVNVEGNLAWGRYDVDDPLLIFKVSSLTDGTFSIQHVATGQYIANGGAMGAKVQLSEVLTQPQQFQLLSGTSQWNIADVAFGEPYHTDGHLDGKGLSGDIVHWSGGANTASAWYIQAVTDEARIAAAVQNGASRLLAARLQTCLDSANAMLTQIYHYDKLLTKGSQITSNAKTQNNNVLLDGIISYDSEFESIWNSKFQDPSTEGIGYHNLQITLNEPIDKFYFEYYGRPAPSEYHDNPNNIGVYVTNNPALGIRTAAADSSKWVHVCDLVDGFPPNVSDVHYESPMIFLDAPYKYVRLVVRSTTNMNKMAARIFANPFSTGVTFNIAELQFYGGEPLSDSEYFTVPGMKEAADKLTDVMKAATEKVTAGVVTAADVEAMKAAMAGVNELRDDRAELDERMAEVLEEARRLYTAACGAYVTLVTDAEQFSSNNMSIADYAGFDHLIDGDLHYTHNFHSVWNAAMQNAAITAAEWEQVLAGLNPDNYHYSGTGYHNLQVALHEPVSHFWFEMTGRTGTKYVDTPTDIEVYATNDDDLGARTDQADISRWTRITELKDNMPDATEGAKYISPVIQLGDSYRYIRFVIKQTALSSNSSMRNFARPDVTGVTWNVGEWQLFKSIDAHRQQYNYNPEMKAAVDAMKVLMDAAEAMEPLQMSDNSKILELQAAVERVSRLYADTTQFATLYQFYREMADNAEVGEGTGYVDSHEAILAFTRAIEDAKSLVDPEQPYPAQIEKALVQFSEAYRSFMTHVDFPNPNTWYTIVSGSIREYAKGQPIFLNSSSLGGRLSVGGYPFDVASPDTDPYAVWRLVPVNDDDDERFYVQNAATGQYWGAYRGLGGDAGPWMEHTPCIYHVTYYGQGGFRLQQEGLDNPYNSLKADQSTRSVLNGVGSTDRQQCWKFIPSEAKTMAIKGLPASSVQIMTLPFATGGDDALERLNPHVKTYAVHHLTKSDQGDRLGLMAKTDFEAGEPFILVVNDIAQPNGTSALRFRTPETVTDTSSIVANGLVGTLEGVKLSSLGMGIFVNNVFTTVSAGVTVPGGSGYLDPRLVVNVDSESDQELGLGGQLNAVKSLFAKKSTTKTSVFTLDGRLVKQDINATDALRGLSKGIYVVGKKKILVK